MRVAGAALRHALGECDGSCTSLAALVDDWDHRGQHLEAIRRRLLLSIALIDHDRERGLADCKEVVVDAASMGLIWYLRYFLRPLADHVEALFGDGSAGTAVRELHRVDPEHWRRPIILAIGSATPDLRLELLEGLATDPSAETVQLLRDVVGRDAETLRARLIRDRAQTLFIKSFGGLRIRVGGWDGPETTVNRPRQRALLGYLVARIDNPPARDQVIEALWPDADLEDAVNSLNQSVYQLRRAIDPRYRDGNAPQYVISTTDTVRLDSAIVHTDLAGFRESARELDRGPAVSARAIASRLIQFVDGEFLSDLVYEDWADRYRLAVHAEVRQVLIGLTQGPWLAGFGDLGLRAAVKLAELDPWDEQAHLAIARCLQAIGRGEAARQVVRQFLTRLRDDLGQSPEADFSGFDSSQNHLTDELPVK